MALAPGALVTLHKYSTNQLGVRMMTCWRGLLIHGDDGLCMRAFNGVTFTVFAINGTDKIHAAVVTFTGIACMMCHGPR